MSVQTPLVLSEQDTLPSVWDFIGASVAILWRDWHKNMQVGKVHLSECKFNLTGTCPHCDRPSVFKAVTNSHLEPGRYEGQTHWISGLQCIGCQQFILGIVTFTSHDRRIVYLTHYPIGKPNEDLD